MTRNIFAAMALIASATSAHAATILTNGGFESPVIGDSCCNTVTAPNSFPGWMVTTGDINIVKGTFSSSPPGTNLAFEGNQYLDLIGQSGSGAISQQFSTVLGQVYSLTFAYSHNLFGGLGSASAAFSVDGLSGTVTHNTGSTSNLDWRTYTGSFTGTGSPLTLSFTNTVGSQDAGILLDAVSISAVPEPAAWLLMIGGFGVAGTALRYRRRRTRVVFG